MDTWLRDHLIRSGHMTETGATRKARLRPCPGCPHDVLVGLDDVMCALEVQADPVPLSELGEALAVLQGRRTFHLRREGSGWVIDRRDAADISAEPASTGRRTDVLLEHACSHGPPAPALRAASTFPETRPPVTASERPPF